MATLKTTYAPPTVRVNGQPDVRGMDRKTLLTLYPPKLEPMGQGRDHFYTLVSLVDMLIRWLSRLERFVVLDGDNFIYYLDEDGVRRSIVPDVHVSFDIDADMLDGDQSYFVERLGKPPEFALEIASPNTAWNDLHEKPGIYAHIGISQYWMFDPTGGERYGFALQGLRLVDGVYEPIEMETLPDGSARGHCDILKLDLCWENGDLRLRAPSTGEYLQTSSDLAEAQRESQRQLADEREARRRENNARDAELAALREEVARLRGQQD